MAEYCVHCNKKIGFFSDEAFYIEEGKPICHQCAEPIVECFNKLYNCTAEEAVAVGEQLIENCQNTYDEELLNLIVKKFDKQRILIGLLTTEERGEKQAKNRA